MDASAEDTGSGSSSGGRASICIPDILYIICSLLDIKDLRRFRLCGHAFAAAAAPFVHRRLVVYPHKRDLDMLRRLSLDPVAAPNVRNLVYVGHVLQRPKLDFEAFQWQFDGARKMKRMLVDYRARNAGRAFSGPALVETVRSPAQIEAMALDDVRAMYREYCDTIVDQDFMLTHDLDTATLLEAVPRFTSLREFTFSSYWEFHPKGAKTPFDGCLLFPGPTPPPRGSREAMAFLEAAAKLTAASISGSTKLESLTLGLLSWRFFEQDDTAFLARALHTCRDLTTFRVCIDTGMKERPLGNDAWAPPADYDPDEDRDEEHHFGTEVAECSRVMAGGMLREFLRHLPHLETLQVSFLYNSADFEFPALLGDVIQPRHRWDMLTSLKLENVACERQELLSLLRRHRDTLEALALHSIALRSTSWLVLLPQIRKHMTGLVSVSIGGELFGRDERDMDDEYWDLNRDIYASELKFDINRYLRSQVITRCPLTRENNEA